MKSFANNIALRLGLLLALCLSGVSLTSRAEPTENANPASASSSSQNNLIYLPFREAAAGFTEKEGKDLKGIFDQYKVLDLKKSNLSHLEKWLNDLNVRLTSGIEKQGTAYPNYKIYVMASEEPTAFVYKSQPPGHKVYRGHVFISSGMIQKMIDNLGTDLNSASPEEFQRLLSGIQGVMSHEFTHPKQDEIVKWDWRAAQNGSRQNHGQLDELTTDIMAMNTLRDSKLAPTDVLTGLELIFGEEAQIGRYKQRALGALASSHPEDNLRLNLNRGALTKMRMEEGHPKVVPIAFNRSGLNADLNRVLFFKDLDNRLEFEVFNKPGSPFINVITALRERLTKADSQAREKGLAEDVIAHLRLLRRAEEKNPHRSDEEIQQFEKLIDYLLGPGRSTLKENDEYWMTYHENGGGTGDGESLAPAASSVRKFQRELMAIKAYRDPRFGKWLNEKIDNNFMGTVMRGTSSFEALPRVLPRDVVKDIYKKGFTEIGGLSPEQQVKYLLQMWHGALSLSVPPEIERDAINKIRSLITASPEAMKAFRANFPNVTGSQGYNARMFLSERFVRYKETNPKESQELLEAHAGLLMDLHSSPDRLQASNLSMNETSWKVLNWHLDPESFLLPFKSQYPVKTEKTFDWLLKTLRSKPWIDQMLDRRDNYEKYKANEAAAGTSRTPPAMQLFQQIVGNDYFPFSEQQRLALLDVFLAPDGKPLELTHSGYYTDLLGKIRDDSSLRLQAAEKILSELKRSTGHSHARLLTELGFDKISERNPSEHLELLRSLREKNLITKAEHAAALDSVVYVPKGQNVNYKISSLNKQASFRVWELAKEDGLSGSKFIKHILNQFELSQFDNAGFPASRNKDKRDIQNASEAGVGIHPQYARFLSYIAGGLKSDFLKEFGFDRSWETTSPEYINNFRSHLPQITEFYKSLFNPDNTFLPSHLKSLVDYKSLDELANEFAALVPKSGLSREQYYEIWKNMAAKRANRASDELFSEHVRPYTDSLPPSEVVFILENGLVRSERAKVELLERVIAPKIDALLKNKGNLADHDVSALIVDEVSRFIPGASRFRDDLLEKLAWRLELNEKQLIKFVEPMKSFNFKALDLNSINLLSLTSVLIERLPVAEKLAFLKYIQHPKGELVQALPTLRKGVSDLRSAYQRMTGEYLDDSAMRDLFEKLEGFIRDAGEGERLILNEMLIGTRTHGLWYGKEQTLEEVYKLANLDPEKLKLFKAYIKALPKHERTVVLSYLLAAAPDADASGSQLLRVLELHNTPGIKFAQMASILSIFGDEEAAKLAAAKDKSNPPTRAEIYQRLREIYSPQEFASIKRLKSLAGSGGIKHVVLMEFDDGHTEAVYLKRKNLENTIDTTLGIVEEFARHLRELPEYKDAYDYDHYLTSLRGQLATEVKFERELELSKIMGEKYSKIKPLKGWAFEAVRPSERRTQNGDVLHFAAVQGAVPFDSLSDADKKIASELILSTELDLLLREGVFDADRHLGNYLFDPVKKKIYPIDFSQVYSLTKNGLTKPGDPYQLAKILYGLNDSDTTRGAKNLSEALVAVSENGTAVTPEMRGRLESHFRDILSSSNPPMKKLLGVLSALTQERVHLPLKFSLGVFKGFSILMNEDYAKNVPDGFIKDRVEGFVRRQLTFGKRFDIIEGIRCLGIFKILGGGTQK